MTDAPSALRSGDEGWELRRVRWQIELVFKAFKTERGSGDRRGAECL